VYDRVRTSSLLLGKLDQLIDDHGFPLVVASRASILSSMRDVTVSVTMTVTVSVSVTVAVNVAVMRASIERCELLTERADLHRVTMIPRRSERFPKLPIEPGVEPTIEHQLRVSVPVRGGPVPTSCDVNDLFEILALLEVRALGMRCPKAIR